MTAAACSASSKARNSLVDTGSSAGLEVEEEIDQQHDALALSGFARAMKIRRSKRCTSCSFLSSAPCSGGMASCCPWLRSASGGMSSASSSLSQSISSRSTASSSGRGLRAVRRRLPALRAADRASAREMHVDDARHRLLVGELDVVEEAAAQEGVGQFLFVVRGDDDRSAGVWP
jgi:hypothetical protein